MARPGEVQQRAPADAPHGEGAALQRLQESAPIAPGPGTPGVPAQPAPVEPANVTLQQPYPAAPPPRQGPPPEPPQMPQGDLTGGYDSAMFAPSNRPDEPITAGAPFGPGPNFIPRPGEDDHEFMLRVANQIGEAPGTTQRVRTLAERIRLGE